MTIPTGTALITGASTGLGAIYAGLSGSCPRAKLMLATYFGPVSQDIELTASSCSVLHIDLVRETPEALKPRRIEIGRRADVEAKAVEAAAPQALTN